MRNMGLDTAIKGVKVLKKSSLDLRKLAGEGRYNAHRIFSTKRRWFICLKYLAVTLSHYRGMGKAADNKTVVFVKSPNQLRYWGFIEETIREEFGPIDVFTSSGKPESDLLRVTIRFSTLAILKQLFFLILAFVTGRRRFLNLYFLNFQKEMDRVVLETFQGVKHLICFNDQPYDVAAVLNSLHRTSDCRTIVVQHGLILSDDFYFPTIANEFWAWGSLSEKSFRSWSADSKLILRGRYASDLDVMQKTYIAPNDPKMINLLIAPSHKHEEVHELLDSVLFGLTEKQRSSAKIAIKLHPSTKFKKRVFHSLARKAPWLRTVFDPMEELADRYDALITKNSTSAVDFLLRGKPVFFLAPEPNVEFPSLDYGFPVSDVGPLIDGTHVVSKQVNAARKRFLQGAINV